MEILLCSLCDECGFLKDSKVGVLREDMGLLDIIEQQIVFPCHLELKGFNHKNGIDSENTNAIEMARSKNQIKVCKGYIQSLVKSGIQPKHSVMEELMSQVGDIGDNIMTIPQTIKYHKGKK